MYARIYIFIQVLKKKKLPSYSVGKKICLQCRRPGFHSWVRKIPWRRKWQPTPVFLPGEFHCQRSQAGYSPWTRKSQTRLSDQITTMYKIKAYVCVMCICCSVAQSCPRLCDLMDCNRPDFPVLHYLPEFSQTHVHWCHPTMATWAVSFSSCPQSFPAWRPFPVNQLFTSGGQSVGTSASASVLPMNIQGWFPLGLTDLILLSKGLSSILQPNRFWVTSQSDTQCAYLLRMSFLLHSHDIPGTKLFLHSPYRIQEMKILKKKLMTKIRARKMTCLLEEYG